MIALFALLSAIIILMAFTPLGYARIGIIEATLLMIPVAIGAIRMGPTAGGLLGAVFGLTSFAQCFGISPFGTTLFGISPISTFILTMVPRIAMGVLVALVYRVLTRSRVEGSHNTFALGIAFFFSALLNTVLFVGFFLILFGRTEFVRELQGGATLLAFFASFVGINGVAEAIIATISGTAIRTALQRANLM